MTVTSKTDAATTGVDEVPLTIDGVEVSVPKGTLVIRAAERIGVAIPRFCDHPLLDPVGACRQCLVEVPDMGNGRGMPKPQASCTLEAMPGMKISTQVSSEVASKAQSGMLELLLINHPLDCPICDKGGECPLQNQSLANGRGESRYHGLKRTFPKPVSISPLVLLDRERCVLCARCTRFSDQISGDRFIALVERGALQQVGIYETEPYDSYFSGNVIQICPVGALTSADYRFQSRPFDLVSTTTSCEVCASGCELRTDQRHFQVKRRLAGTDPQVNEEWNCDVGRFGFFSGRLPDRLTTPLVRRDGALRPASWPEAIDAAVAGLSAASGSVGVITGGRLLQEDAYAYQRFARAVLGTNNVDFRVRASSAEEEQFLAATVAGAELADSVTYADLQAAQQVILVGFEPEEESPMVFLRLRKAVRKSGVDVKAIAPLLSAGNSKLGATLIACVPGAEAAALAKLRVSSGTVVLVGERLAQVPGALSAAASLAKRPGVRLAWIPRRAGELGAVEAGCLPTVLPGGRPVSDSAARVDVAAAWDVDSLPSDPGLDTTAMLAAAASKKLKALVIGGAEVADFADPAAAAAALDKVGFLVSIETRLSDVSTRANVVFPVALTEERSGTFVNWEHRPRPVARVNAQVKNPMTDVRVLAALADALGRTQPVRTAVDARRELDELGPWEGDQVEAPTATASATKAPAKTQVTLATWRELIDDSRHNDGSDDLQATAKQPVAKMSPATAKALKLDNASRVTISSQHGSLTFDLTLDPTVVDQVVWVPSRAVGQSVPAKLRVGPGAPVTVAEAKVGGRR